MFNMRYYKGFVGLISGIIRVCRFNMRYYKGFVGLI